MPFSIKIGCQRIEFRSKTAFSLVEVVIAIGIFAFVAISLLGLLTLSAESSRRADTQAASATIVTTVMGKLSSQNFATNVTGLPFTNYFTVTGAETNASAAIYRCSVTDISPSDPSTNFMRQVRLLICWPSPAYTQTNTVIGSFEKYE